MLRRQMLQMSAACVAGAAAAPLWAQSYPTRPISLVVPFPPGGVADIVARPVAEALSRELGQPVVIENKPGAGGGIGMGAVAKAKADGYTLLMALSSLTVIPEADAILGRAPMFALGDLRPIARYTADPTVLAVRADSPWKTYDDFVTDAKRRPDTIAYSSSGAYSAVHLPIEMLAHSAGIKLRHIPYSGGGPALTAVLGNVVATTAGAPAVLAPQIKAGELRALVTTGVSRHPLLPDVPTAKELGYQGAEFYLWVGLFASAKTDEAMVQQLRRDVARAAADAEFVQYMGRLGAPLDVRDGPAFQAFLQQDSERISAAIRRIGKVD